MTEDPKADAAPTNLKVVEFRAPPAEVDKTVVEALELLLEKARAGQISQMHVACVENESYMQYIANINATGDMVSFMGFLDICKLALADTVRFSGGEG